MDKFKKIYEGIMNENSMKSLESKFISALEKKMIKSKDRMNLPARTLWFGPVEVILYSTTNRGDIINIEGKEYTNINDAIKAMDKFNESVPNDVPLDESNLGDAKAKELMKLIKKLKSTMKNKSWEKEYKDKSIELLMNKLGMSKAEAESTYNRA